MIGPRRNPSERLRLAKSLARVPAFTLVELLVVIAIIAILAALLLPVLERAQDKGRTAVCRSNLHQYGLALRLYVEDFKVYPADGLLKGFEVYSMGGVLVTNWEGFWDWNSRLRSYTKAVFTYQRVSTDVRGVTSYGFQCPSYTQLGGLVYPPIYSSYAYNVMGYGEVFTSGGNMTGLGGDIVGNSGAQSIWRPVPETVVVKPDETIAIADSPISHNFEAGYMPLTYNFMGETELGYGGASLGRWFGPDLEGPSPAGLTGAKDPRIWIRKRHANRWNVLFCDGHQENLRSIQLWNYSSDVIMRRWSRDNQRHYNFP